MEETLPPSAVSEILDAPVPSRTADGILVETLALLVACQEATYQLEFERAEALARRAMALDPTHPLPGVFLQMALLSRIQEVADAGRSEPGLIERFERESAAVLLLARKGELRKPDGRSQLYLGLSLGAGGLLKMIQGSYFKAYDGGQAAVAALRLAVERDPTLYDAYLGLGQYDYYCGRLGGFLRFVTGLTGDIRGGIAKLETCALKGGLAGTAARINLARIYSLEEVDFARALPYVREMRRRFPGNYSYVQYALATARGQGHETPGAQSLLESVFKQWDQGWRPPSHVELGLDRVRLELAQAYLGQGQDRSAKVHFSRLAGMEKVVVYK